MKVKILLDSVEKVMEFVGCTKTAPFDIDLSSGTRTYLDAKSILGILSCDIRKPITVDIYATEKECEEFVDSIDKFRVA